MKRGVWLAAPLLLVLGAGVWLMVMLLEDGGPTQRAGEAGLVLPSGLVADLQEMLQDRQGQEQVYRFRFVAPDFVSDGDTDRVMADLEYLCTRFALPKLASVEPVPDRIIISLADKPSEFGQFDPAVTQVFEAYHAESGDCIWEMF